jgi:hypothetical protein
MPNPFNPLSWMDRLFEWFVSSWMRSGGQALQDAIKQLSAAQFPNLGQEWFLNLWNSTFGLSLVLGLFAVMVHGIIFTFKSNYATLGQSVVNFLKLLMNGGFLLVVIVGLIAIVDLLVKLMTGWTEELVDATTWTTTFSTIEDLGAINIWLKLSIAALGLMIGNLLFVNTLSLNFWIYIFIIWYLLSSALGVGKVAQFVRSMLTAGILTVLFARVFQVFHLGLSAVVINIGDSLGASPLLQFVGVYSAGGIALMIPLFMFVAFTVASFKVEQRLDIRNFIRNQTRNTTSANSSELADERVSRVKAIGNGAKDAAGGALRWAALAASTAAFAKIGASIASKAAATTPTPHSKLAAVGLKAAQFGATWLEGKSRSYIDNRVGRPGASRARNRSGTS